MKRGRGALDALDALKLGLLSGTLDTAALARLKSAAAGLGSRPASPGSTPCWPRSRCASRWNSPRSEARAYWLISGTASADVFHVGRMTDFAVVGRAGDGYTARAAVVVSELRSE